MDTAQPLGTKGKLRLRFEHGDNQVSRLIGRLIKTATYRLPIGNEILDAIVAASMHRLTDVSYKRLQRQGFLPNGIVDIGADVGDWTRKIKAVFSDAPVLMVEAREAQRDKLEDVSRSLKDVRFEVALLGPEPKSDVEFFVLNTGSSIYSERSNAPRSTTRLPMKTLDELLVHHDRLKPPLFLKLDVQGAELDILKGGNESLARAELVQLEVPFASYNEGAPTAADVIAFMDLRGFVLFDVVGFVRHKDDLLQADFLFAHRDSKLRRNYVTY